MRIILAFLLPPVAVLSCGRPLHALLNVLLTACFWVPGVVHALTIVQGTLYDRRIDRTMRQMEAAIAEHRPEAQAALDRRRRRQAAKRAILGGTLLLVCYVLSTGPMAWLIERNVLPAPAADFGRRAYLPLDWLAQEVEWVGSLLEWYRRLWTG